MSTAKMEAADQVMKLVNDMRKEKEILEDKLKKKSHELIDWEEKVGILQEKCEEQNLHSLYLAEALGNANDEIDRLKKKLKDMEQDQNAHGKDNSLQQELKLPVFPAEIWEMIFNELEDPKDLKNCCDAHPLFPSVLHQRRMITDGMRILAARGDFGTQSEATSELLKCRTVSKRWKNSIDDLFRDEVYIPIFPAATDNGFKHPVLSFKYFDNPWQDEEIEAISGDIKLIISRFLEYNESYPVHPRVTQSDIERFRGYFLAFLKKFGHHVWYFKIQMGNKDQDSNIMTDWFTLLKTWLSLFPNLKALHIDQPMCSWWREDVNCKDGEHYDDDTVSSDSDESMENADSDSDESMEGADSDNDCSKVNSASEGHQTGEKIDNLNNQLESGKFPRIESLRTLVLEDCLPSLATSILESNPQIERLKIKRDYETSKLTISEDIQLNALQELSLDVYEGSCSEIEAIKCTPLRKLAISATMERELKWNDLYRTIGTCFGKTLVDLTLDDLETCSQSHSYYSMSNHRFGVNINSPWKSLKKLTMTYTPEWNLSGFFQSLSVAFGSVVTELKLQFHDDTSYDVGKDMEFPRLNMPSLKVLSLEITESYKSIDFVLPLLNLEILRVRVRLAPLRNDGEEEMDKVKDMVETIKFIQFIQNPRESTIWQFLPKLKLVDIRTDHLVSTNWKSEVKKSTWQFCSRSQLPKKRKS